MSIETAQEPQLTPVKPDELPFVEETVQRLRLDPEDLRAEQFVALRRDGRIIAFGRIKPYGETY